MRSTSAASEVIRKAEPFTVRRHRGPSSVCSCARAAGSAAPALANCTPQGSRARRRGSTPSGRSPFPPRWRCQIPPKSETNRVDEIAGTAGVSAPAVHTPAKAWSRSSPGFEPEPSEPLRSDYSRSPAAVDDARWPSRVCAAVRSTSFYESTPDH